MSARYSKTASRGRAMTTSTVIGSTGAGVYAAPRVLGGAALDRLAALGVVHDLGALGPPGMARTAQLADERGVAEAVDALADQRRAAAVVAARAVGLQGTHALA